LSDVINSAGWEIWNTGDDNTDHVTFEEYGNTGSGASGTRASFSSKASSPLEMSSILSGYTSWADASYL
jgi:pectinesterase